MMPIRMWGNSGDMGQLHSQHDKLPPPLYSPPSETRNHEGQTLVVGMISC